MIDLLAKIGLAGIGLYVLFVLAVLILAIITMIPGGRTIFVVLVVGWLVYKRGQYVNSKNAKSNKEEVQ